uniref:Transmembrane protein n=1 Tax=Panagrellus redivivus TaxID=6233 RepID=A0A7E4V523_PANRE
MQRFRYGRDGAVATMMGPRDPFLYTPTPHLICIILFVIFPLIYICGRIVTYLLWQTALCFKYLVLAFLDLYRDDEVVPQRQPKRRRLAQRRAPLRLDPLLEGSQSSILEASQNGTGTSTVKPASAETTALAVETAEEAGAARKDDEPMHHSPTDDEDDEAKRRSGKTKHRHRKHDNTSVASIDHTATPVATSTPR